MMYATLGDLNKGTHVPRANNIQENPSQYAEIGGTLYNKIPESCKSIYIVF